MQQINKYNFQIRGDEFKLAIQYLTYFSPLHGYSYNLEGETINTFLATGALDYGKVVTPAVTTGILSLASVTSLGGSYFLFEHVTADGPSLIELERGMFQYEKKASATCAVTCLNPKRGAFVRTKWVVQGSGGQAIAVGQKLNVVSGVFATTASNDGTCGIIKNIYTDTLGNVMYDVELY
jgi:hypothetical protein